MVPIRLLTSIAGGPVEGAAGDVVEVDPATAAVWADGERAELVAMKGVTMDDRRTSPPDGEQATAAPLGEQATTAPGGERATRPPRGEQATRSPRPKR